MAAKRQEWAVQTAQHLADAARVLRTAPGEDADGLRMEAEFAMSRALICAGCVPGDSRLEVMRLAVVENVPVTDALRRLGY